MKNHKKGICDAKNCNNELKEDSRIRVINPVDICDKCGVVEEETHFCSHDCAIKELERIKKRQQ